MEWGLGNICNVLTNSFRNRSSWEKVLGSLFPTKVREGWGRGRWGLQPSEWCQSLQMYNKWNSPTYKLILTKNQGLTESIHQIKWNFLGEVMWFLLRKSLSVPTSHYHRDVIASGGNFSATIFVWRTLVSYLGTWNTCLYFYIYRNKTASNNKSKRTDWIIILIITYTFFLTEIWAEP